MSEYLRNTLYHPNEIAKTEDFNFGQDRIVENIHAAFRHIMGRVSNNTIIHGLTVAERSSPSMNVDIEVGASYDSSNGEVLFNGALKGPIAIVDSDSSEDRIDTVEVKSTVIDYNTSQRAFKDSITGSLSYTDVSVRQRYDIESNVVTGTNGSGTAPSSSTGYIKIAEVYVAAGSTAIYDADIRNVTATIDGEGNPNWTNETTSVFKIGDHPYVKSILRTAHNEDGTHKTDSIKDDDIDFGSGSGQVSASDVPIDQTQLHYSGSTQVMAALDDIDQELYDQVNIDSSNLHYSSTNDLHTAIDDIDQTQYDHNTSNITSSNSVHGIQQGSGGGFDADQVDGYDINNIWPVGVTYWQLPGEDDPGTLGLPGTWDNISSNFAGDFFRAEGGNASSFGGGRQADQNESHNHSVTISISDSHSHTLHGAQTGTDTGGYNHGGAEAAVRTVSGLSSATVSDSDSDTSTSSGGGESRPLNRTIRIWKRTA